MANITTCPECGKLYEAGSEEQANEPGRLCPGCFAALVGGDIINCARCGKVVRFGGGVRVSGELLCTSCYFESDAGRAALAPLRKAMADVLADMRTPKTEKKS
jgi:hypothetical protein